MRFRFLGAADGHVTGSCTHFHFERTNVQFLVDCGMRQGEGAYGQTNGEPFDFDATEIAFVLLTHAHLDHCGLIPKLYRDGFKGDVICTSATAGLAKANLKDAARFSSGLYSAEDVELVSFRAIEERTDFGSARLLPVSHSIFTRFTRSAHILGACSIVIGWEERDKERRYLVMSGDLGSNTKSNPYQSLLAGRHGVFAYPDYLVVESTYGGKTRDSRFSDYAQRIGELADIVEKVAAQKGVLVVPAFALHRTQELLVDFCAAILGAGNKIGESGGVDIVLDSRLAAAMTKVFRRELGRRQPKNPDETLYRNRLLAERFGLDCEQGVDSLLDDWFDTKRLGDNPLPIGRSSSLSYQIGFQLPSSPAGSTERGLILISGGGMCEGGPIVSHLEKALAGYPRPVTVLVCGYMDQGSLGARLLELADARTEGKKPPWEFMEIGQSTIAASNVDAEIRSIKDYYSGHADESGLLDFIFSVTKSSSDLRPKPMSVFINHGRDSARRALKQAIEGRAVTEGERPVGDVYLPDLGSWFDLDAGTWATVGEPRNNAIEELLNRLLREQRKTNDLLTNLIEIQGQRQKNRKFTK